MEERIHCNTCNLDLKSNPCYKKHLKTIRHIERSTNVNIVVFTCICGRSYSYNQSLNVHQKTCEQYQTSDKEANPHNVTISSHVQQLRTENTLLKEKHKSYEKELADLKAQVAILLDKHTSAAQTTINDHTKDPLLKSRNNRTNIKKNVRKQIVDEQENTCGDCKQILSIFFQIDHIVALQFGGTNDKSNLMALCCECHTKKSIHENQRRKQIRDAIQTILQEEIPLSSFRCNTCKLDFKTNEYYKRHLITNRHVVRTTNPNIITFSCICGRSYSHNQSLYTHRKTCEQHRNIKPAVTTLPVPANDDKGEIPPMTPCMGCV